MTKTKPTGRDDSLINCWAIIETVDIKYVSGISAGFRREI